MIPASSQTTLAAHRVNLDRVRECWTDMLRVAGSLSTGAVRAYDLMRMMSRDGHPSRLGQAFAEYGRIPKTVHLLSFVDVDDSYRRRTSRQLTISEGRHQLGRKICHGHRGQLRQAYRKGQEDQLGALGLVLNAVVLWWSFGTRSTWTPRCNGCVPLARRYATRTWPDCRRSASST